MGASEKDLGATGHRSVFEVLVLVEAKLKEAERAAEDREALLQANVTERKTMFVLNLSEPDFVLTLIVF